MLPLAPTSKLTSCVTVAFTGPSATGFVIVICVCPAASKVPALAYNPVPSPSSVTFAPAHVMFTPCVAPGEVKSRSFAGLKFPMAFPYASRAVIVSVTADPTVGACVSSATSNESIPAGSTVNTLLLSLTAPSVTVICTPACACVMNNVDARTPLYIPFTKVIVVSPPPALPSEIVPVTSLTVTLLL